MAAAARTRVCLLFRAGHRICSAHAHVGTDCFPTVVLFRLWIYGHDESVTDRRRQTPRFSPPAGFAGSQELITETYGNLPRRLSVLLAHSQIKSRLHATN